MSGKYTPFEQYLRNILVSQREVTLPFEQIERILNDKLPRSAYQYQAWWANEKSENHVHSYAWMNAGWKAVAISFSKKWVRFVRN